MLLLMFTFCCYSYANHRLAYSYTANRRLAYGLYSTSTYELNIVIAVHSEM